MTKIKFKRVAANTYEATRGDGTVIVQRDVGATTWSAYTEAGATLVDHYPGSRATAAGAALAYLKDGAQ